MSQFNKMLEQPKSFLNIEQLLGTPEYSALKVKTIGHVAIEIDLLKPQTSELNPLDASLSSLNQAANTSETAVMLGPPNDIFRSNTRINQFDKGKSWSLLDTRKGSIVDRDYTALDGGYPAQKSWSLFENRELLIDGQPLRWSIPHETAPGFRAPSYTFGSSAHVGSLQALVDDLCAGEHFANSVSIFDCININTNIILMSITGSPMPGLENSTASPITMTPTVNPGVPIPAVSTSASTGPATGIASYSSEPPPYTPYAVPVASTTSTASTLYPIPGATPSLTVTTAVNHATENTGYIVYLTIPPASDEVLLALGQLDLTPGPLNLLAIHNVQNLTDPFSYTVHVDNDNNVSINCNISIELAQYQAAVLEKAYKVVFGNLDHLVFKKRGANWQKQEIAASKTKAAEVMSRAQSSTGSTSAQSQSQNQASNQILSPQDLQTYLRANQEFPGVNESQSGQPYRLTAPSTVLRLRAANSGQRGQGAGLDSSAGSDAGDVDCGLQYQQQMAYYPNNQIQPGEDHMLALRALTYVLATERELISQLKDQVAQTQLQVNLQRDRGVSELAKLQAAYDTKLAILKQADTLITWHRVKDQQSVLASGEAAATVLAQTNEIVTLGGQLATSEASTISMQQQHEKAVSDFKIQQEQTLSDLEDQHNQAVSDLQTQITINQTQITINQTKHADQMRETLANHTTATANALADHNEATATALANHTQATAKALADHGATITGLQHENTQSEDKFAQMAEVSVDLLRGAEGELKDLKGKQVQVAGVGHAQGASITGATAMADKIFHNPVITATVFVVPVLWLYGSMLRRAAWNRIVHRKPKPTAAPQVNPFTNIPIPTPVTATGPSNPFIDIAISGLTQAQTVLQAGIPVPAVAQPAPVIAPAATQPTRTVYSSSLDNAALATEALRSLRAQQALRRGS